MNEQSTLLKKIMNWLTQEISAKGVLGIVFIYEFILAFYITYLIYSEPVPSNFSDIYILPLSLFISAIIGLAFYIYHHRWIGALFVATHLYIIYITKTIISKLIELNIQINQPNNFERYAELDTALQIIFIISIVISPIVTKFIKKLAKTLIKK